jgi:hypothetical protein
MMRDTLELPPGVPPVGLDEAARKVVSGWLLLGVGALAASGVLAVALGLARTPFVGERLPWLAEVFFRKALVVHVVLAFVVWFLAMLGGLSAAARPGGFLPRAGLVLASAGAILLLVPALIGRGEPLLINYVPILEHPLFLSGLAMLAAGVALPVIHLLLRPPSWGASFSMGLGAAGVLYLLALVSVFMAWKGFAPGQRFGVNDGDILWGGGHLLQLVNTAMALTAWQTLGEEVFERPPMPYGLWQVVCVLLVATGMPGPILYAFRDLAQSGLRDAFTKLYWFGLTVPLGLATGATLLRIVTSRAKWQSPAYLAVVLSVATFAVGGLFGFFADGGDERTPAHYHAEIVGVNLALIGLFFTLLLPLLLRGGRNGPLIRWQFWLLAVGQMVGSLGMFIAGWAGVGRKVAGAEQGLDNWVKIAGMGLHGVGGLVAVAGGVLFIVLALSRLLAADSR